MFFSLPSQLRLALGKHYEALLQRADADSGRVSQDGYVQLLVDLRYLQDICSGGRSQALDAAEDADAKDAAAAAAEAGDAGGGALLSSLLARVHAAIDPFDMDVYDPFLKKSRAVLLSCSTVLLGHFTSLQPQHAQVRGRHVSWGCPF